MRLSSRIINLIQEGIINSFGRVDIYLFGSRVDDLKKGGDIDLALDIDLTKEDFRDKKIKFITYMVRQGFDFKIDIVQYNKSNMLLYKEIEENNIKLDW